MDWFKENIEKELNYFSKGVTNFEDLFEKSFENRRVRNSFLVSLVVNPNYWEKLNSLNTDQSKYLINTLHQGLTKATLEFRLKETKELANKFIDEFYNGVPAKVSDSYDAASEVAKMFHSVVAERMVELWRTPEIGEHVNRILKNIDLDNLFVNNKK